MKPIVADKTRKGARDCGFSLSASAGPELEARFQEVSCLLCSKLLLFTLSEQVTGESRPS